MGVTQLRDVVYVICVRSPAIRRYNATTHQRLADIVETGLVRARDIAACELTSQLYVATFWFVWRVSSDGVDIQRWMPKSPCPDTFNAFTISVTSSRLLVTSHRFRQLRQFDTAGGDELRRVDLPDYIEPLHAVESPTATFIVSHRNRQLNQVTEVSTEGQVLRQFTSSSSGDFQHIAVDRQGNIFVGDTHTLEPRILLIRNDTDLPVRRVIIDTHQLSDRPPKRVRYLLLPLRLCYMEQSGQLLVGFNDDSVAVYDVLRR